jgi:hypothetical protein
VIDILRGLCFPTNAFNKWDFINQNQLLELLTDFGGDHSGAIIGTLEVLTDFLTLAGYNWSDIDQEVAFINHRLEYSRP